MTVLREKSYYRTDDMPRLSPGKLCLPARPDGVQSAPKLTEARRRYVGNKIAVFTMQSLGCDVAALNTVQFS